MLCKHCGEELVGKGDYCSVCGKSQKEEELIDQNELRGEKNEDKKPQKNYFIYGILGLALAIALFFIFTGNPVKKYISHLNKGEDQEASILYEKAISGNQKYEQELKENLTQNVNKILDGYVNGNKDYEKAKSELSILEKSEIVRSEAIEAMGKIDKLNNSRIAYNKGLEFQKAENYLESLIEFRKVVEIDDNYDLAKENIDNLSKIYEEDTLKKLDSLVSEKNYDEAIREIKTALKALPDSQELIARLDSYEKLEEEKSMEEMKEKMAQLEQDQEVAVVEVSQYNNSINTNFIAVTVENRSDKTVKEYTLGFMGFDKNNLPVKVGLGSRDFVGTGYATQNILPGESKYSDGGWYLDNHDVTTLIACISEVEYYDGDNWRNPYYNLWLEKYKEKPLK